MYQTAWFLFKYQIWALLFFSTLLLSLFCATSLACYRNRVGSEAWPTVIMLFICSRTTVQEIIPLKIVFDAHRSYGERSKINNFMFTLTSTMSSEINQVFCQTSVASENIYNVLNSSGIYWVTAELILCFTHWTRNAYSLKYTAANNQTFILYFKCCFGC